MTSFVTGLEKDLLLIFTLEILHCVVLTALADIITPRTDDVAVTVGGALKGWSKVILFGRLRLKR